MSFPLQSAPSEAIVAKSRCMLVGEIGRRIKTCKVPMWEAPTGTLYLRPLCRRRLLDRIKLELE